MIATGLTGTSYTFTAEVPAQTYTVQVTSVNSSGLESSLSTADSVTTGIAPVSSTALSAPVISHDASSVTSSGWVESWTPVSGAASHNVYLNGNLVKSGLSSTTYTFSGLSPITNYIVQVSAVDASSIEGIRSNVDAVSTASPSSASSGGTQSGGSSGSISGSSGGSSGGASGGTSGVSSSGANGGVGGTGSGRTTGTTGDSSAGTGAGSTSGSSTGDSGKAAFNKVLVAQQVTDKGATVAQSFSGNNITVTVPAGAFASEETVSLSTASDTAKVTQLLPKGSNAVVSLGVGFSGNAPKVPVTVTIHNSAIPAGAQIFKVLDDGSLVPVKAQVSAGQAVITFSSDPNFVVVKPAVLKGAQREIQFNSGSWIVPGIVHNHTTYMPIWYVMQAPNSVDVTSHWDGRTWNLKTIGTADLTGIQVGKGQLHISVNGTSVQNIDGMPVIDPSSHKQTMYMPVWYVMQALDRVGIHSTWDGAHWVLSK